MEAVELRNSKRTLYVFDGIIATLCLIAIVGYFILPIWQVRASVRLYDAAVSFVENLPDEGVGKGYADAILAELTEEDLTFSVRFRIPTAITVASVFTNDKAFAERQKGRLLDAVKQSASADLQNAAHAVAQILVKTLLQEVLTNFLSEKLQQGATPDLQALGITDDLIGSRTDGIVEDLLGEQVEAEALGKKMTDALSFFVDTAAENTGIPGLKALFGEEEHAIGDSILSMIEGLTDGRQTFAPSDLLLEKLGGQVGLSDDRMQKINGYTTLGVSVFLKIVGALVLFSAFCFLYPVIKIAVKLIARGKSPKMKNPGVTLTLPIVCGWLPELVLVFLPGLAMLLLSLPGLLMRFAGGNAAEIVSKVTGAVSVSFFSSGIVAFAVAVALFILMFFNGHYRRKTARLLEKEARFAPPVPAPSAQSPQQRH